MKANVIEPVSINGKAWDADDPDEFERKPWDPKNKEFAYDPDREESAWYIFSKAELLCKHRLEGRVEADAPYVTFEYCEQSKAAGTEAFKAGDYATAASRYEDAGAMMLRDVVKLEKGKFTRHTPGSSTYERAEKLISTSYLNSAQCFLKLVETSEQAKTDQSMRMTMLQNCVWHCKVAMAREGCDAPDKSNPKALFRLATARMGLKEWKIASSDLRAAIKLAPKDKALRTALDECTTNIATEKAAEKARFAPDKFAKAAECDAPLRAPVKDYTQDPEMRQIFGDDEYERAKENDHWPEGFEDEEDDLTDFPEDFGDLEDDGPMLESNK